jgi:predicted DNA binding protein
MSFDDSMREAQRSYDSQSDDSFEDEDDTEKGEDQLTEEELHLAEEAFRALGKVI